MNRARCAGETSQPNSGRSRITSCERRPASSPRPRWPLYEQLSVRGGGLARPACPRIEAIHTRLLTPAQGHYRTRKLYAM